MALWLVLVQNRLRNGAFIDTEKYSNPMMYVRLNPSLNTEEIDTWVHGQYNAQLDHLYDTRIPGSKCHVFYVSAAFKLEKEARTWLSQAHEH